MFVSVGVAVGRGLRGGLLWVNSSSLPATLSVGAVRAHQFNDMDASLEEAASAVGTYVREGNLTWQDEFDGVDLDAASQQRAGEDMRGLEYWWHHEEGDGCEMNICGFGNGEAQWYRRDNTAIRDGKLIITAKAEPYAGNIYTSAKLSTNTSVSVTYGRVETRVKLPRAQGLWPSIWMLPQDSPYGGWASGGSINIMEARNDMSRVHGQLAFGGAYPDVETLDLSEGGHCYSDLYDNFSEDYHVYAVEWEPDSIRWYVDGVLFCDRRSWYSRPGPGMDNYPFPAPFDTGFYLIMNVAVGGTFTGGLIDEDALAENPEMLVDYVRVYQLEGQSIYVEDRPEIGSQGGGGTVDAVTAVSVLVVLLVLFSLCMTINCVAKRMSKKRAAAADAADALKDADAVVGGDPSSIAYASFNGSESLAITPRMANGMGKRASSTRLMLLRVAQQEEEGPPLDGDGGDGGRNRGFGSGVDGSGGGVRGASGHGGARGIVASKGDTGSPLFFGAAGDRADVAPSRFEVGGTTNGGVGVEQAAERRAGRIMRPRPPSGKIPDGWAEEKAEDGDAVGGEGLLPREKSSRDRTASSSEASGGGTTESSPVRISSVEVSIGAATASSCATSSTAQGNGVGVASWTRGDGFGCARVDEDVWMGSTLVKEFVQDSSVGYAGDGSVLSVGSEDMQGSILDYPEHDSVLSATSEDSELPPTMASLRLDAKPTEEADPAQTGLPSYEEAAGQYNTWRAQESLRDSLSSQH